MPMPRKTVTTVAKNKSYSKYKKKQYKKKTPYRGRLTLSGFPDRKMVKLRYVDSDVTLDAGAGLVQSKTFSCNSLFDPDITSVGHQPMGYDQWSAIYQRYTVLSAKITVRNNPIGVSNVNPFYFGVTIDVPDGLGVSSFSSINNLLESKYSQGYKTGGVVASANNNKYTFPYCVKYWSAKKMFGLKNVNDGQVYTGLMGNTGTGASPAVQGKFVVWSAAIDGNDPGAASLTVEIDYIAMLHMPNLIDGS